LLRSNEQPLTSLANELEFIQSYYHLLKTRHGEALSLITRIRPGTETLQLPPLTLQLLIENAVKHNIILPELPLKIVLTTDAQQRLIVSNNLQRKASRALSNGIGLNNILTKYRMLGQPMPKVEEDGQEFRVTLPLV
jgi:LytS/YehU family sensor histidine kinase